ncbi:hypothetical protein [Bacteroides thetaiotaomicron]|uniref:hypothetical protein n=1 Tax=Bacteroides thetaiotaomicron TaxID=818 RepID=UPI001CE30AA7|nr:hypothetical protein [Bacteroides thetaiotaomicron]MCA6003952.1 hypothetical protein [Bacteroides thetaiotaomicron]
MRQQWTFGKKRKERLTDGASKFRFVCKSFLSSDFPSVACFRCRMLFKRMAGIGKVFGLNTLRRRKILPETACRLTLLLPSSHTLPLHPCIGNEWLME